MRYLDILRGNRGMAMVLAISLIGLLSLLGIWLIMESTTATHVTKGATRSNKAFNIADGALQVSLRCIRSSSPAPSFRHLVSTDLLPVETGLPGFMKDEEMSHGEVRSPKIHFVGHNTLPPPGWMITWQGYSNFHSMYYEARGEGRMPLPASKGGDAVSLVGALTLKVSR